MQCGVNRWREIEKILISKFGDSEGKKLKRALEDTIRFEIDMRT